MVRRREEIPSIGELVVGTVDKIFEYGAYLKLDEYNNMEAYLPWSEVSSKWVKDIRDVLKEGQKVVVKVIRIDKKKGHIDVSLKRVSDTEQRNKMIEFKRAQRAEKMLEVIAQKVGKRLEDAYREVGWKLEDAYGEIFRGFEEVAIRGEDALRGLGIPDEWIPAVIEEVRKHIKPKKVSIRGVAIVTSTAPDGVERVKEVLTKPLNEVVNTSEVSVKIYTLGAPRYAIEVVAQDYKIAEKILSDLVDSMSKTAKKLGVSFTFQREKS